MSKFKAGDKVRRLYEHQSSWWNELCDTYGYNPTEIFEVSHSSVRSLSNLKELDHGQSFDLDRFELVTMPVALDDCIKQPNHYILFDDVEAIEIIARSMTLEQFKGYILGSVLKYRLRAGKKSEMATMEKDLAKAAQFAELFEKHKGLCHA